MPTSASPNYNSLLNISYTQTVKSIAILNGISSTVSSATYTLDNVQYSAPSLTDTRPLQVDLQTPEIAVP